MRRLATSVVAAFLAALAFTPPAHASPASSALVRSATLAKAPRRRPPPPPQQPEPAARTATPEKSQSEASAPRGPTRIDFDDRLIQGQTNKSGAVYLFDRKELSVRSMVRQRSSFRDQIVKDVFAE